MRAVLLLLSIFFVVTSLGGAAANEAQLVGLWKLESLYTEIKASGEKRQLFGEKPKGYSVYTPEKRVVALLTAESRKKPETDEDRVAGFRSMFAVSGIYRIDGEQYIIQIDVSWNEALTGTEPTRLLKFDGPDKMSFTSEWAPSSLLPGKPETRAVAVYSRVKGAPPSVAGASSRAAANEAQLVGLWKLESWYTELKASGEKRPVYGEKPKGYLVFTPEKRLLSLLTGESRKKPETDEDRAAAMRSMFSASGEYRVVDDDKYLVLLDVSANESLAGSEQTRSFTFDGPDKLSIVSSWSPSQVLPGSPEARGVTVYRRVKGAQ